MSAAYERLRELWTTAKPSEVRAAMPEIERLASQLERNERGILEGLYNVAALPDPAEGDEP